MKLILIQPTLPSLQQSRQMHGDGITGTTVKLNAMAHSNDTEHKQQQLHHDLAMSMRAHGSGVNDEVEKIQRAQQERRLPRFQANPFYVMIAFVVVMGLIFVGLAIAMGLSGDPPEWTTTSEEN